MNTSASRTPGLSARALLVVIVTLTVTGCSVFGVGGSTDPNEWWLNATTPDGRQLLITSHFGGVASGCARWEDWQVDASADAVEVQGLLWSKHRPGACTDDGASRTLLLALDEPLGDRVLSGCEHEDCRREEFPDWLGGHHGQIVRVEGGVVVADANHLRGFGDDGKSRWEIAAALSGELFATSGVVVTSTPDDGTVAWDAITGERRWDASEHPVTVTDQLVVLCGQAGDTQAVDAATGQERWRINVPCSSAAAAGDIIAMVTRDPARDGGQQLVVVNTSSGEVSVQRQLDDGADDRVGAFESILAMDDGFVAGGDQADLVVLAPDGTERHRFSHPEGRPIGAAGDTIVLQSHDQVSAVDLDDGQALWEQPTTASQTISFSDGMLLLLEGPSGQLSPLDLRTGRPVWTTAVGTSTGLGAAVDRDHTVFVRTALAVLALDARTGNVRWWEYSPPDATDVVSTRP